MDGIIDQEIMDEINAEQAGSEAADERADALSEDTGAEGGATGAEAGAPGADEAGELPELSPMPGDDAGDAGGGAEGETSERAGGADEIPAAVLGLLGVSTQREAMERLTDIAVSRLVDDGAPESVARELVELRMRVGGAFRARDEPAADASSGAADASSGAAGTSSGAAGASSGAAGASSGAAGASSGAAEADVSPRIREMAMQARYIEERTGVNMLEVLKADGEIMRSVSEYNEGRGGYDMMGAYNAYRDKVNAAKSRARVPATSGMAGGQTGSGRTRVEDMTDADIEKIEERVRRGERVIL